MKNEKTGFTLAEIMIVLSVIGVLTAILLPVAKNAMPNKDVMKFKKAHNAFYNTIRELVTSDKYYSNGDLGIRADGTLIDGTHEGDFSYFCQAFSDVVSIKSNDCSIDGKYARASTATMGPSTAEQCADPTAFIQERKERMDVNCKSFETKALQTITLADNVVIYELNGHSPYGISNGNEFIRGDGSKETCEANHGVTTCNSTIRYYSGSQNPPTHGDCNGFDRIYKRFCLDIDGMNNGEDPFGYGVRADGKIMNSARVDEWLEKSIQENN